MRIELGIKKSENVIDPYYVLFKVLTLKLRINVQVAYYLLTSTNISITNNKTLIYVSDKILHIFNGREVAQKKT